MRLAAADTARRGAFAATCVALSALPCEGSVRTGAHPTTDESTVDGSNVLDARPSHDDAAEPDDADAAGAIDASEPPDAIPGVDAGERDAAAPPIEPCAEIPGASFSALSIAGAPSDRPPPEHGDLNLELRGWTPVDHELGLVDIDGPTDDIAPTLATLFTDDRVPTFVDGFAVHQWDWGCNCRGGPIDAPEVTLSALGTAAGEILEAPDSGYDIGDGHDVLVLYVGDESVTLKYTREDNVVSGYTVHVQGVCVDPRLRALYDASDRAGRADLPALRGNQAFARARGDRILVAIRDTGSFMDPRSRKDWW